MRIFFAGASGVIGSRLVPLLVDAGHTAGAMTRSAEKADRLAAMGTLPAAPRVHIDVAAARTLEALDAPSGILNVVE